MLLTTATLGFASLSQKIIYIIRHGEKVDGYYEGGQLQVWNQCLSQKGWTRAYNLKSVFGPGSSGSCDSVGCGRPFRTPDYIFAAFYAEPLECRDVNGFYRTHQTVSALADNTRGGLGIRVDDTQGFMPSLCGLKWNPKAKAPYGNLRASQPEPFKYLALNWSKSQPEDPDSTCYPYDEGIPGVERDDQHHHLHHDHPAGSGMCCNPAAAAKMLGKLAEPGIDTILVAWESHNIQHLTEALGVPKGEIPVWNSHNYDSVYVLKYDSRISLTGYDLTHSYQGFDTFDYLEPGDANVQHYLGPQTHCGPIYPSEYPWDDNAIPHAHHDSPHDNDGDGKPNYDIIRSTTLSSFE